jgi:pimeloyl-ACP methyl ester carboxylesterase
MHRSIALPAALFAAAAALAAPGTTPASKPAVATPVKVTYQTTVGGKPFGTEDMSVVTSESGRAITGAARLTLPNGTSGTLTQDLETKPDGTPVSYRLDVDFPGQQVTIKTTAVESGYTVALYPKGGTEPLKSQDVPAKPPVVLLDNTVASHFELLTRRLADLGPDQERSYTFLVPQVGQAIPGTVKRMADGKGTLDGKPVSTRGYRLTIATVAMDIVASAADGAMLEVDVPIQQLVIARQDYAAVKTSASSESRDSRETATEVKGPAGGLPAVLLVPKSPAAVPAVVFLSGSGPNDRDETIGPNKPFLDIARGLGDRGIATLRFDKRTRAQKDKAKATLAAEYYEDAAAAILALGSTPGVDPKRVFVLGHSEGAMVAPKVARDAGTVRGVVLMAPAVRPIDVVIIDQTEFGGRLLGQSDTDLADQTKQLRDEFAKVKDPSSPDGPSVLGAPRSYWREVLALDVVKSVKDAKVPVLVLQGDKDIQVRKDLDFEALRSAVGEDGGRVSYTSFPDLNHLFIRVEGKSSGAEYGLPGRVDPAVMTRIADWILAH